MNDGDLSRFSQPLLRATATLLWAAILAAPGAGASSFDVQPVRLEIGSPREVATLRFRNRGSNEVTIQARAKSWLQDGGESRFPRTDDLIVSPPFFTLVPGIEQVVRVGLRHNVERDVESAYRIFFTELPRPREPADAGLSMSLSLAIPVFVAPDRRRQEALEWSFAKLDDQRVEITLRNAGNRRVQVKELRLRAAASERELAVVAGPGYVLARRERRFIVELDGELDGGEEGKRLVIAALTDRGSSLAEARHNPP